MRAGGPLGRPIQRRPCADHAIPSSSRLSGALNSLQRVPWRFPSLSRETGSAFLTPAASLGREGQMFHTAVQGGELRIVGLRDVYL